MIETQFGGTPNQEVPTPGKALEQTRQLIAERSQLGIGDLLFRYVLVPLFVVIGIFGLLKYVSTGEGGTRDISGKILNVSSTE